MTKLKQIVEKSNQNADFTANYQKNIALRKKLFNIGSPIAIISFIIAATSFILIGVFGSDLKSIHIHTGLLIAMFVLLVVFSVAFGFGLYILKQASSLHLCKQTEENNKENIENKKVKE